MKCGKKKRCHFLNDSACFFAIVRDIDDNNGSDCHSPLPKKSRPLTETAGFLTENADASAPDGQPFSSLKGSMVLPTIIIHHSNGCCSGFSPDSLFHAELPDRAPYLLIQLFIGL